MVMEVLATVTILVASLSLGDAQKNIVPGPRGDGTVFKACGGNFLGGNNDRCYEVEVSKLKVQMGNDGTNDDVRVKICSDTNKKKPVCCRTDALKVWPRNKLQTWNSNVLGSCSGKKLSVKQGLNISLEKTGRDSLKVNSIILDTKGVTAKKDKTNLEQFNCPAVIIAEGTRASNSSKPVACKPFPYTYERVKLINVTMGNQGSDDDVLVDICSDVNQACCRTKLSGLFDDWERNKNEVWDESYYGKCKTQLYKVRSGLKLGVFTKKRTTKALVVNKILVTTENQSGKTSTFDCKGFTMTGKDFVQNTCTKNTGGSFRSPPASKRTRTTKRTTTKPTTKKKGLISSALDLVRGKKSTTIRPTSTTRQTRPPFRSSNGK